MINLNQHSLAVAPPLGKSNMPDAPYRNGTSGKYKLLVKNMISKQGEYEYLLVDADGKEYTANSKTLYAVNHLIPCIVFFKTTNTKLLVTGTIICDNNGRAISLEKDGKLRVLEGSPSIKKESGYYRLIIVARKIIGSDNGVTRFVYTLIDDNKQKYHTASNIKYSIGKEITCRIKVEHNRNRTIYLSAIAYDTTSKLYIKNTEEEKTEGKKTQKETLIPILEQSQERTAKRRKKKITQTSISQSFRNLYKKGNRYTFVVTDKKDKYGNLILEDFYGYNHVLLDNEVQYSAKEQLVCTVKSIEYESDESLLGIHLILSEPKIDNNTYVPSKKRYDSRPESWTAKVDGYGKHRCGKAFTCNCCGRHFPKLSGWRVELKDLYFCDSCAASIFKPAGRGNHHVYIPTPMGNKR